MANDIIQRPNFESAKERILSLSKNVPATVHLDRFRTDGTIIPWNNHNITGDEVNRLLVSPLQETLISLNGGIKDLFEITNDVYKAFDFLDKEYIAGIVGAVNAAKEASDQALKASNAAKEASDQAFKASNDAKSAQDDIKRTIEALQKTVNILNNFKNDISDKLDTFIKDSNQTKESINNRIEELISFQETKNLNFNKKIRIAYGIAGASITFSLIQLVLQLLGML